MSTNAPDPGRDDARHEGGRRGVVKSPEDMAAGLFLIVFAAILFYAGYELKFGQMRGIGPGLMPRVTAVLLGGFGLLLVVQSLIVHGSALQRWSIRGPFFIFGGVLLFALTIRGVDFGLFKFPALGLAVAGPLAVMFAAFADRDARPLEVIIYAACLTLACIGVFKFALRLPIPLAPWLVGY